MGDKRDENENESDEEKLLRRACDAAMHNDANALAEALCCHSRGSHQQSSLHTPLLNSTPEAQILHHRLFHNLSSAQLPTPNGGRILRALVMVPPTYATPWLAALQFIEDLQHDFGGNESSKARLSRSSLRSSVTEIQTFLQQTVSAWWDQERRRNSSAKARPSTASPSTSSSEHATTDSETPRYWIIRLVQKLMEPLILQQQQEEEEEGQETQPPPCPAKSGGGSEDSWMMPLEILVATIVSTMHDLEDSLNQEILDCVFSLPHIRPDRLLPWLSLATDLHSFLRPNDWKMLLRTLQRKDQRRGHFTAFSIQQQDFPGLMTAIVSLSSTLLLSSGASGKRKRSTTTRDIFRAWKRVALNLWHAASVDPSTFSTVTTVFQERLSGLPSDTLHEWICLDDDEVPLESVSGHDIDNAPNWVKANMILAVMRSARNSGSSLVDSLLSRALANTKGHCDVSSEGWKALVGLACADDSECTTRKRGKSTSQKSWIKNVESLLKNVSYIGKGRFGQDHSVDSMICNQVGELIYQSLFLQSDSVSATMESSPRVAAIYVIDRAQDWISAANARLKSQGEFLASQEVLVIAVAFITVVCEVTMSRSSVVRGMAQCLSGENDFLHSKRDIALLNCLIVSVIVRSNRESLADATALNPIVDILAAGKLDKPVFIALAQALAPTSSSAQQAMLALSRKRLQSSFSNVLWGAENFGENCDRIQCSLFSLCMLIKSSKWNESAAEAWKILSEVIVLNRPALPVAARSWLFLQIQDLVDSESFSQEPVIRLSRSCLLRLLQFIGNGKSSGQANIDPRSVFAVWSTPDARSQCSPVEDLPGLYKLAFSLFFRIAQSEAMRNSKAFIDNGRLFLLRSCCSNRSVVPESTFGIKNDNEQILHSTLAISLVVSAIGFVSSLSLGDSERGVGCAQVSFDLDTKSVESQLIAREEETASQQDFRPLWLELLADSHHGQKQSLDPPEAAIRELGVSLCSTVAALLRDHRWSFAVASGRSPNLCGHHKGLLLSLSFLSKTKKAVSDDEASQPPGTSGILSKMTAASLQRENADTSAFFIASATLVDHALSVRLGISEMNAIFAVIMDFLDDLKDALAEEAHESRLLLDEDLSPVLHGLWVFYKRVCDEDASVRLIAYLEESIATSNGPSDVLKQSSFLEAIESSGEIDSEIRSIRHSVLCALHKCMHAAVKGGTGLKLFTTVPLLEPANDPGCVRYRWSAKPGIQPISFLANCLEKLVNDLQTGLEGHSGGISTEMYMACVDSLDTVSTLLALHVRNSCDMPGLLSLLGQCSESAQKMQTVLCSFPPAKKSSFMKAFLFLSRTLPTLARCATRKFLLSDNGSEETSKMNELEAGLHGMSFAVASFEDCTIALRRWIGLEPLFRSSWTMANIPQITDDEQSMLLDGSSSPIRDSARGVTTPSCSEASRSEVPSVVTVPKQSTPQSQHGKGCTDPAVAKLLISSKDVWSWACSSAVISMESAWLESLEAMHQRVTPRDFSTYHLPLPPSSLSYIQQRTSELSSICQALGLAFAEVEGDHATMGTFSEANERVQTGVYLAETFPSDAKHRLCSLIDRVIAASDASVKLLESIIRQTNSTPSTLCFLEAFVCMLVFCRVEETDSFDIFYCFRRWHEAEKRGLNQSRDAEEKDIMRHFPKVLFRMEKLESNLHKLHNVTSSTNSTHSELVNALDGVLTSLNACGICGSGHSFSAMVKKWLNVLTQGQLKLRRSSQVKAPLLTKGGKSKRGTRRQELHRRPMRSRNATVDKWLRSDQQMGDVDDDAYLDLEDFVADG